MKQRNFLFIICLLMALTVKADEVSYYFWKGKIDGNEVKMACAVKDDVMTGELFQNIEGGTYVYNVAGMKTGNMFDIKVYHDVEGNIIHTYFIRAEIKNGHLVGISDAVKHRHRTFHVDFIYHLTHSSELIDIELRKAIAPRPNQVHEQAIIHSFHQERDTLMIKSNATILRFFHFTSDFS